MIFGGKGPENGRRIFQRKILIIHHDKLTSEVRGLFLLIYLFLAIVSEY
jgi:hypothetical protein